MDKQVERYTKAIAGKLPQETKKQADPKPETAREFKDNDICFVVPWSFGSIYAENQNKKCSDCTTGYLRWFQVSKTLEVLHCTNILVRKWDVF